MVKIINHITFFCKRKTRKKLRRVKIYAAEIYLIKL